MAGDGEFDLDKLIPIIQRLMEFDEEGTMHLMQAMGSELARTTEKLARTHAENLAWRHYVGQIAGRERQLTEMLDRIQGESDRDEWTELNTEWLARMGDLVEIMAGFSRVTT